MHELGSWCVLWSENLAYCQPLYDSPFISPQMLASNRSALDLVLSQLGKTFPASVIVEAERGICDYLNQKG